MRLWPCLRQGQRSKKHFPNKVWKFEKTWFRRVKGDRFGEVQRLKKHHSGWSQRNIVSDGFHGQRNIISIWIKSRENFPLNRYKVSRGRDATNPKLWVWFQKDFCLILQKIWFGVWIWICFLDVYLDLDLFLRCLFGFGFVFFSFRFDTNPFWHT